LAFKVREGMKNSS